MSSVTAAPLPQHDFDGDGRSDVSVYFSAEGNWAILQSRDQEVRIRNWGWNQTEPAPGDFDGDGQSDICVYDSRNGLWYLLRSSGGDPFLVRWGAGDMDPVLGDFDGDGKHDFAVYQTSSGAWCILNSSDSRPVIQNWGFSGAQPVPGDYDGDGKTDMAVYLEGTWYILYSHDGSTDALLWGWADTEPVQADYDGDGKTDMAVFHAATGYWIVFLSSTQNAQTMIWGNATSQPMPGDYDGDGKADFTVYTPDDGRWCIARSSNGQLDTVVWGAAAAEPAAQACRLINDDQERYGHSYGHDYDDENYGPTEPIDFGTVEWLHTDVSGWARTATLPEVSFNATQIIMEYDKANVWPDTGRGLVANPWIFVPKDDGGWYAATWEWLRPGQTRKARSSVAGDHIKRDELENFLPVPGAWYGFMVSGLARDGDRNVLERSNVVLVQWPSD
ncbi:MAG: VCBS repeat-containing protein [Lentisphaerae bacterium]|nr:VCBS repeat-containing protein [Lentisphaerota bacterium]